MYKELAKRLIAAHGSQFARVGMDYFRKTYMSENDPIERKWLNYARWINEGMCRDEIANMLLTRFRDDNHLPDGEWLKLSVNFYFQDDALYTGNTHIERISEDREPEERQPSVRTGDPGTWKWKGEPYNPDSPTFHAGSEAG